MPPEANSANASIGVPSSLMMRRASGLAALSVPVPLRASITTTATGTVSNTRLQLGSNLAHAAVTANLSAQLAAPTPQQTATSRMPTHPF